MGINSTEVGYGFGQLGSMLISGDGENRPPKGMVFVAITFLTDCQFDNTIGLVADNDAANGLEYIGTGTAAHDTGDTTSTASTSGSSTTLTLGGANADIKPGMIIESQGDTDIPYSLTAPTTVVSYDGATTVVMSAAHNVNSQTVGFFKQRGSGFGGAAIGNSIVFPKGMTIYGRWTEIDISSSMHAVAYLGQ